jgi:hypothetical protein
MITSVKPEAFEKSGCIPDPTREMLAATKKILCDDIYLGRIVSASLLFLLPPVKVPISFSSNSPSRKLNINRAIVPLREGRCIGVCESVGRHIYADRIPVSQIRGTIDPVEEPGHA